MTPEERIAHHCRMAEGYRNAYLDKGVWDGEEYEAWQFAEDGVYLSPYFTGDQVFPFSEFPTDTAKAAMMEAKAYSLNFPDWRPTDFKYWSAVNGFVMKTRWEGHTKDGTRMGFFSYSFVDTNAEGEVSRWETHVDDEYSRFLEVAIGIAGPFNGTSEYVDVLERFLENAGVAI